MSIAPPRVRKLSAAVIGDVHLGTKEACARELYQYLNGIAPEILVIAGDFIDLDAFQKSNLPASHLDVIRKVLEFANQGTRVYYLTGNHDGGLRKFGDLALGDLHVRKELQLKLDGRNYYIMHGDKLDAAVKYKINEHRLGGFRHRMARFSESFYVKISSFLGGRKWSLARESKMQTSDVEHYLSIFERLAARVAYNKGCESVICAHVHRPKKTTLAVESKEIEYLNPGDWVSNLTALEYRFEQWSVVKYDEHNYPQTSKLLRVKKHQVSPFPKEDPASVIRQMLERG